MSRLQRALIRLQGFWRAMLTMLNCVVTLRKCSATWRTSVYVWGSLVFGRNVPNCYASWVTIARL